MAASEDRATARRDGVLYATPVATGGKIYAGTMVWKNTQGYAVADPVAGYPCLGCAEYQADNTNGQQGDITVITREGEFNFANSSDGDAITIADVGNACYAADNQTLSKTSDANSLALAGYVKGVDDDGSVWAKIRVPISAGTGMVGANNLSECTAPATARAAIGANLLALPLEIADLKGADSATAIYRIVAPVGGVITKIKSVLEGHALATGNATLTASIGATPVTQGVITITQVGSAIGDVDTCSPNAARTVVEGNVISIGVSGTNDNSAATAKVTILIAY